jgi:hypothetical protein
MTVAFSYISKNVYFLSKGGGDSSAEMQKEAADDVEGKQPQEV